MVSVGYLVFSMFIRGVRGVVTWCSSRQAINSCFFLLKGARPRPRWPVLKQIECRPVLVKASFASDSAIEFNPQVVLMYSRFCGKRDQGWPRSLQLNGVQVKSPPHYFCRSKQPLPPRAELKRKGIELHFPTAPSVPYSHWLCKTWGWVKPNITSFQHFSVCRKAYRGFDLMSKALQKPYKVPVISSVRRWGPCSCFRWGTKPTLW